MLQNKNSSILQARWRLVWFALCLIASCSSGRPTMRTGCYLPADRKDGIAMQKDHTTDVFYLSKTPFAAVEHIRNAYLGKDTMNGEIMTHLCMEYDSTGIRQLKEITGNPSYPRIGIVVANKLLYVVDNLSQVQTGLMCIILEGYQEDEMESMLRLVKAGK